MNRLREELVHWQQQGKEPDYRFSLANERTLLAWIRTALAILAGAILFHQFAARLKPDWIVTVLAIAVAVASGLLGAGAYLRWKANETAMRLDRPLPRSRLLLALAVFTVALAVAITLLLLLQ